jgi:hypothetical protein
MSTSIPMQTWTTDSRRRADHSFAGNDAMTILPNWEVCSDGELTRAAAAGDQRAFAAIYDRYADRLHDFYYQQWPDGGIELAVDVTDAGGAHHLVFDNAMQKIWEPLSCLLARLLEYAYYLIRGGTGADPRAMRTATIIGENAYRREQNLPTRNVNYDAYTWGDPDTGTLDAPTCAGKGWTSECNIATAALGSPIARQIAEFRRAKRELETLTLGSVPLFGPMLTAYQLFSPLVAGALEVDAELRGAMVHFGVQPAVCLVKLARVYLVAESDGSTLSAKLEEVIGSYLDELPDGMSEALTAAAGAARDVSGALVAEYDVEPCARHLSSEIFATVASLVRASEADSAGPAWVLAGLALVLDEAADAVRRLGVASRPCLASPRALRTAHPWTVERVGERSWLAVRNWLVPPYDLESDAIDFECGSSTRRSDLAVNDARMHPEKYPPHGDTAPHPPDNPGPKMTGCCRPLQYSGPDNAPAGAITPGGLAGTAKTHNSYIATQTDVWLRDDTNAHRNSDGKLSSDPGGLIDNAGYHSLRAENVAWGFATAAEVVRAWMQDDGPTTDPNLNWGHRNNILNCDLLEAGTDHFIGGTEGHYWTIDFGTQ